MHHASLSDHSPDARRTHLGGDTRRDRQHRSGPGPGRQAGQVEFRFSDNGCGFDPVARSTAGNGLTNLRRRIRDLGGTLELQSSPGAGFRVEFRVPLPTSNR